MRNLILIILICISIASFGQENECIRFKNGKYKILDNRTGEFIIERKGSKQVEYGGESKLKLEFKVTWLNECIYTLELEKILENPNKMEIPKGMILTVEIIETKDKSYIQKSRSNLYDLVLESELIKIE